MISEYEYRNAQAVLNFLDSPQNRRKRILMIQTFVQKCIEGFPSIINKKQQFESAEYIIDILNDLFFEGRQEAERIVEEKEKEEIKIHKKLERTY